MVSAIPANRQTLEAIKYEPGKLLILDQLALPHETKYVSVLHCWKV
jgi:methylthioribose-1-phosphate isomerase